MSQITKRFIGSNQVDETKIRLSNDAYIRARNAADSADINILKVNTSDRILFSSVPQVSSDASAGNDLVRYSQIQSLIEGLKPKEAVRVATTGPGTLATDFENGDTVDGITLATGDRILIKDQTASEENGIYVVNASGAPTRASDFNAVSEIPGSYTVAQFGTSNQGVLFVCLSSPAVLGTDPITFASRSIATYTGGDMITLSGNAFSVDLATVSGLESSNPGNAAGQLRVKLEASNPSLQIDGSNQLGVKIDTARSLSSGASGLGINLATVSGLQHTSNQLAIKLEASNPSLQIDGSNQLGAKLDAAGAILSGASGLYVNLESSNPTLQISTNQLGVKLDAAGAIITGASGIKSQVDAATVKINGSNQLEALKGTEQTITLTGTDITNQYVDLAKPVYGTSASDNSISLSVVGGPVQQKTVDYTVSLTGGSGGVTRITFAGDLATGGNAALISGDKLIVSYQYLT